MYSNQHNQSLLSSQLTATSQSTCHQKSKGGRKSDSPISMMRSQHHADPIQAVSNPLHEAEGSGTYSVRMADRAARLKSLETIHDVPTSQTQVRRLIHHSPESVLNMGPQHPAHTADSISIKSIVIPRRERFVRQPSESINSRASQNTLIIHDGSTDSGSFRTTFESVDAHTITSGSLESCSTASSQLPQEESTSSCGWLTLGQVGLFITPIMDAFDHIITPDNLMHDISAFEHLPFGLNGAMPRQGDDQRRFLVNKVIFACNTPAVDATIATGGHFDAIAVHLSQLERTYQLTPLGAAAKDMCEYMRMDVRECFFGHDMYGSRRMYAVTNTTQVKAGSACAISIYRAPSSMANIHEHAICVLLHLGNFIQVGTSTVKLCHTCDISDQGGTVQYTGLKSIEYLMAHNLIQHKDHQSYSPSPTRLSRHNSSFGSCSSQLGSKTESIAHISKNS